MTKQQNNNFLRAENILESWPDWKRGYQLTKFTLPQVPEKNSPQNNNESINQKNLLTRQKSPRKNGL